MAAHTRLVNCNEARGQAIEIGVRLGRKSRPARRIRTAGTASLAVEIGWNDHRRFLFLEIIELRMHRDFVDFGTTGAFDPPNRSPQQPIHRPKTIFPTNQVTSTHAGS
jgi:hypothetical protein